MDAINSVKAWLVPILLAIIGFFLMDVIHDIKEVKSEVVQLRIESSANAVRIQTLEVQMTHALSYAEESTATSSAKQPTNYSGGHHPKPSNEAMPSGKGTAIRMRNTGGSSGGMGLLCDYREDEPTKELPTDDGIPWKALQDIAIWLCPAAATVLGIVKRRRIWALIKEVSKPMNKPPNL